MTRINHIAICSDYYAVNARFYQALFDMKTGKTPRPARALSLSDGYVGLNHIPRREGRRSGLDHFGVQVDNIEETLKKIATFDPAIEAVKRPSVRPFAAYSTHDPDGNIFDLSVKSSDQKDVFAEAGWEQPRFISHLTLRTRNVTRCAAFYEEVLGLTRTNSPGEAVARLFDGGRMTLVLVPWRIADYVGQDPAPIGSPEHIGFTVESVEAIGKDLVELAGINPQFITRPLGLGDEGAARLQLLQTCTIGRFEFTDLEGVYIDVSEAHSA
jgi:catechol 2,3-dioxygenase-like lactoylglutathione lyase family enzyme